MPFLGEWENELLKLEMGLTPNSNLPNPFPSLLESHP